MRFLKIIGCIIILTVIHTCARAREAGADNRHVLALYDSTEDKLQSCNIHKRVEMPLNRLGMVVDYHDVNNLPFPDSGKYRAVVIWFSDESMKYADQYLVWLIRHLKDGGRVVMFNGLGANEFPDETPVAENLSRAAYEALGLRMGTNGELADPFQVKLDYIRKGMFSFETRTPPQNPIYRDVQATDKSWKVWMGVSRADVKDSSAIAIATGKKGGIIVDAGLAVRFKEEPIWQIKWDLNPFAFLEESLDCKANLRPDTTTAFGNRAAFSHLDGDGEHNYVQDIPGGKRLATDVLFDDILSKYPLPVTVSFIASVIAPEGGFDPKFLPLYKKIMALPNVQTAVHGYTHPMNWEEEISGIKIEGYKYSVEQETVGAMKLISKLVCPPDKPAELFLWTGDCMPKEDALAALAKAGYYNMNGGDPRYDQLYDGICNICPLTRQLGPYRQIYAAGCNEYLYTDHWSENFGGYANVIKTFENTVKPRYLPVNIYYHIYVCERQAGLRSLKKVYDWALSQQLNWMTAIEYCKSVVAFMNCSTGNNAAKDEYWVSNYPGLNTIRLDNEKRVVDMPASTNVLGFTHFDNSLYVALLPGDKAIIKLADKPAPYLYLVHSAAKLTEIKLSANSMEAQVRLYAPGKITLKNGDSTEGIFYSINGDGEKEAKGGEIPLPAGKGEYTALKIRAEQR